MSYDNNVYYSTQLAHLHALSSRITPINFTNSPYTANIEYFIYADVSAGPIIINLTANTALSNQNIVVRKVDPGLTGNTLTVFPQAGGNIDGAGSYVLTTDGLTVCFVRNGLTWNVVYTNASATGFITGAANAGTAGVGVFDSVLGTVLQFRNIAPDSSKVSVILDAPNKNIDIDVVPSAIDINTLGGTPLTVPNGGTGVTTLTSGNVLVGNGVLPVLTTKPAPVGDFVGTTDVQILTNKTITDTTNNVAANSLKTLTGVVTVSTAAAPSVGQVLTATAATSANWQTPTASVSKVYLPIFSPPIAANSTTFSTNTGYFPWDDSEYSTFNTCTIRLYLDYTNRSLEVRIFDVVAAISLGTNTMSSTGIHTFTFTKPSADTTIRFDFRKTAAGGANPIVQGFTMELSV